MAARRQRCVHCWKLFWPNYRNRTKVKCRQMVCAECGAVIGHRYADQRYRLAGVAPRLASRRRRVPGPNTCSAVGRARPVHDGATGASTVLDLAGRVHLHLAAIAELVSAPAR